MTPSHTAPARVKIQLPTIAPQIAPQIPADDRPLDKPPGDQNSRGARDQTGNRDDRRDRLHADELSDGGKQDDAACPT